jgi:hypothetical protein
LGGIIAGKREKYRNIKNISQEYFGNSKIVSTFASAIEK